MSSYIRDLFHPDSVECLLAFLVAVALIPLPLPLEQKGAIVLGLRFLWKPLHLGLKRALDAAARQNEPRLLEQLRRLEACQPAHT